MAIFTYKEYKDAAQKSIGELPLFYAFSKKQLDEKLAERGLSLTDMKGEKIVSLGAGCLVLKSDLPIVDAYFAQSDKELKDLMQDPEFAYGAFLYEINNHEYLINWQGAYDVFSCFWKVEYAEHKGSEDYMDDLDLPETTREAFRKALGRHRELAAENDWY